MLTPWKESYEKPRQYIKKQRHNFASKGPYSQSFFSSHIQMWELGHIDGWAPKNWCFKLWSWRRLLRIPWTSRKSNQSILNAINPEYSSKGLMLKLKLQYFVHQMWSADLLEKTLMLGKTKWKRRRGYSKYGWIYARIYFRKGNVCKLDDSFTLQTNTNLALRKSPVFLDKGTECK